MAISVASDTPCLDRFPVQQPGPALIYLAEDAQDTVRHRVESICLHRDIDINGLDLHVITSPRLRLDVQHDRRRLEATIKRMQPRVLLLDPLVRLHRLDEGVRHLQDPRLSATAAADLWGGRGPGPPRRKEAPRTPGAGSTWLFRSPRMDRQFGLPRPEERPDHPDPRAAHGTCGRHLFSQTGLPAGRLGHPSGGRRRDCDHPGALPCRGRPCTARQGRGPLFRSQIRAQLKVNNQRLGEALVQLERDGAATRSSRGWQAALAKERQPTTAQGKAAQLRLTD